MQNDTATRTPFTDRLRIGDIVASVLVGVLLLAAAPAAGATTDGPTTRRPIPDAGVTVAYPSSWQVMPHTEKALERLLRKVAKTNPRLVSRLDEQARGMMEQAVSFAVVDVSPTTASSLVVYALDLPFPDEGDLRGAASAIEAQGFTVLETSSTRIGGMHALRLDMTGHINDPDGQAHALRSTQVFLPRGSATTVVQVTSTDDADVEARLDDLLAGIRPLERGRDRRGQ